MELIDKGGEYHLLKCVPSNKCSCGECFFSKSNAPFKCDRVMCLSEERGEEREDVIYVENEFNKDEESEMKTLDFDTIEETGKIKAGETFMFVDCLDVQHKVIAKKVGTLGDLEACRSCVFNDDACCLVNCSKSDRESKDDVYFVEQTKTQ